MKLNEQIKIVLKFFKIIKYKFQINIINDGLLTIKLQMKLFHSLIYLKIYNSKKIF